METNIGVKMVVSARTVSQICFVRLSVRVPATNYTFYGSCTETSPEPLGPSDACVEARLGQVNICEG
jgi:hypothetical protein